MKMVDDICKMYGITPFVVFVLAYEWAGDHTHDHDMMAHFDYYTKLDKFGFVVLVKVPDVVEDFCLKILTGKIKLNVKWKKR